MDLDAVGVDDHDLTDAEAGEKFDDEAGGSMFADAAGTISIPDGAAVLTGQQIWLQAASPGPGSVTFNNAKGTVTVPTGNVYLYDGTPRRLDRGQHDPDPREGRQGASRAAHSAVAAELVPVHPAEGCWFTSPRDRSQPVTRKHVSTLLGEVARRAGIPRGGAHRFRHRFGTAALELANLREAQELLGHASPAITMG